MAEKSYDRLMQIAMHRKMLRQAPDYKSSPELFKRSLNKFKGYGKGFGK